ncbi:pseudouridine synthase [Kangiella marina]|uniref:Pseudouridine synthase n=1 Tax=Kangiella marina TaxID=1079178 RepID=A0ABP8ICV2_9GAMM
MSQANRPSFIQLPDSDNYATVIDFLVSHFPHISKQTWLQRAANGKLFWKDGASIAIDTQYQANRLVGYYREVVAEPKIPFEETIIESNSHFIIAHKPPFLPVMPGGVFVNECLQERLIKRTGIKALQAVHRLDRDTSGLVLLSTNPDTRHQYHQLFADRTISKRYQAVSNLKSSESIVGKTWQVKNYLRRSVPQFLFENCEDSNEGQYAESHIQCIEQSAKKALFTLSPLTGRTHQLRLHMMSIGFSIENDRFYPTLQPKQPDNYQQPMQLHAKSLAFTDPISGKALEFHSPFSLRL